jgi:hypothetical protein
MASKIKVDQIQTGDGTGTIALQNQLSGMTHASVPTLTTGHMPAGNIINVYHHSLGSNTIQSNSTSFVATGLTIGPITPVSASSKFWITFSSSPHMNSANSTDWGHYFVYRDSTRTSIGGGMRWEGDTTAWRTFNQTTQGLDAPNTTSAITYTVRFNTGDGQFHFHVGSHLSGNDSPGTGCDLTILEIKG